MTTGYTRQRDASIVDNAIVYAEDHKAELDQVQAAFHASTGHAHGGATGEGAPILVTGAAQEYVFTSSFFKPKTTDTYDVGSTLFKFKDGFFSGGVSVATLTASGVITGIGSGLTAVPATALTGTVADARLPTNIVRNTRAITAGSGIAGGGDLSADRSIAVDGTVIRTTGNQTLGGTKTFSDSIMGNLTGTVTGSLVGNASTATALQNIRTIFITGNATGSASFDGTADISIPITLAAAAAVPVGTVIDYSGNVAPAGFLKANGAAISRTTYATLFAVCGTTYGVGDGATSFNLPDARGVVIRGWDDGRGLDSGRGFGTYQADAFETHLHAGGNTSTVSNDHTHSGATAGTGGVNGSVYGISESFGSHGGSADGVFSKGAAYNLNGTPSGSSDVGNVGRVHFDANFHTHAFTTGGINQNHTHSFSVGAPTTGNVTSETRVKSLALLKCIKF
jgi:microcystin-dependent protein